MSTGITWPRMLSVAWLYCLQNSMVCTPCGPSAVPTGGAGVAEPASSWIFTTASTFFFGAIVLCSPSPLSVPRRLKLGDLAEFELDRRFPAEDVDQHLELELVLVDLRDLSREVGERAFLDPDRLVDLVLQACPRALGRTTGATLDLDLKDVLDLAARQGRRLGPRTDETRDARRVADGAPGVVVEVATHEQVAREHLLLHGDLFATLELVHVLHGDDDLEDAVLDATGSDDVAHV